MGPMELNDAGPALERALRAAGLDPDRLAPEPAWEVFKAEARRPVASDGDVLYVQLGVTDPTDTLLHVTFIRHLELAEAGELEPVREIVVDLAYAPDPDTPDTGDELCSLDYDGLDEFFAAVEERSDFRQALATRPDSSLVSWSEL